MRAFTIIVFSILTHYTYGQSLSIDSVRRVLENVYETDQTPREAIDSIGRKYGYDSEEMRNHWNKIHTSDSVNLSIVSAILDKYGWLSVNETSKKANEVLFLVIQHSDLATQLKYQPCLKAAVNSGKARSRDFAYLTDRIRTNQGKFQIYGTQFHGGAEGKIFLYPIEDEPNVNKRRKEVDLDSLETYTRKAGVQYTVPKKDTYKNKIVVYGIIADREQKPLAGAEVYLGQRLLAKTSKNGEYGVVIDKEDEAKGLTLKMEGYKSTTFPLTEKKDVYTIMYLLDKK